MPPRYFDFDYSERPPNVDPDFARASERFGGPLDLHDRSSLVEGMSSDDVLRSQKLSRIVFVRPLNIFSEMLSIFSGDSELFAGFNRQLRIGFIRRKNPNAYCWTDGGLTYLGVTSGLVRFIWGFNSHLLSFSEFLQDSLDGANDEQGGQIESLSNGIDIDSIFRWEEGGSLVVPNYRLPKGNTRTFFALNMTHLAVLYVFLHELGHACYRHNEFIQRSFGVNALEEMPGQESRDSELEYLRNRFELLADGFAVDCCLNLRLGALASRMDDGSDYFQWSIAVDLLMWIFSQRSRIVSHRGSHPHPQTRILNKMLHIEGSDYGLPARRVSYSEKANVPIREICMTASAVLYQFWESNRLPGWDNSFFFEEAQDAHAKYVSDLQRRNEGIWRRYEQFVDQRLLQELKSIKC